MSGMRGENQISSEEASDPITPNISTESYVGRARESASSLAERIREPLQPGNTKTTTRKMSDIPSNKKAGEFAPAPGMDVGIDEEEVREVEGQSEVQGQQEEETPKSMLQSASETVASALGGGGRAKR